MTLPLQIGREGFDGAARELGVSVPRGQGRLRYTLWFWPVTGDVTFVAPSPSGEPDRFAEAVGPLVEDGLLERAEGSYRLTMRAWGQLEELLDDDPAGWRDWETLGPAAA